MEFFVAFMFILFGILIGLLIGWIIANKVNDKFEKEMREIQEEILFHTCEKIRLEGKMKYEEYRIEVGKELIKLFDNANTIKEVTDIQFAFDKLLKEVKNDTKR